MTGAWESFCKLQLDCEEKKTKDLDNKPGFSLKPQKIFKNHKKYKFCHILIFAASKSNQNL